MIINDLIITYSTIVMMIITIATKIITIIIIIKQQWQHEMKVRFFSALKCWHNSIGVYFLPTHLLFSFFFCFWCYFWEVLNHEADIHSIVVRANSKQQKKWNNNKTPFKSLKTSQSLKKKKKYVGIIHHMSHGSRWNILSRRYVCLYVCRHVCMYVLYFQRVIRQTIHMNFQNLQRECEQDFFIFFAFRGFSWEGVKSRNAMKYVWNNSI